jgi:hypothetical protein
LELKYIILDQDEFDIGSETSISIACSDANIFKSSLEFYEATIKNYLPHHPSMNFENSPKVYLSKLHGSGALIRNISEYCCVSLTNNTEAIVLSDTFDIQDYIFQHEYKLYRYIWETTA